MDAERRRVTTAAAVLLVVAAFSGCGVSSPGSKSTSAAPTIPVTVRAAAPSTSTAPIDATDPAQSSSDQGQAFLEQLAAAGVDTSSSSATLLSDGQTLCSTIPEASSFSDFVSGASMVANTTGMGQQLLGLLIISAVQNFCPEYDQAMQNWTATNVPA